jgi:hypothetical protein
MTVDGCAALSRAPCVASLRVLDLSRNSISAAACSALQVIVQRAPLLEELDIGYNDFSGAEHVGALCAVVATLPMKSMRTLAMNKVQTPITAAMVSTICRLIALKHLNRAENDFESGAAALLRNQMKWLPDLQSLDLTYASNIPFDVHLSLATLTRINAISISTAGTSKADTDTLEVQIRSDARLAFKHDDTTARMWISQKWASMSPHSAANCAAIWGGYARPSASLATGAGAMPAEPTGAMPAEPTEVSPS